MASKMEKATGGISANTVGRAKTALADNPYQAQEDCHALRRAHEIMADGARMKAAAGHARQEMSHLSKVAASASGATTRTQKSGQPKAASKSGGAGGGPRKK